MNVHLELNVSVVSTSKLLAVQQEHLYTFSFSTHFLHISLQFVYPLFSSNFHSPNFALHVILCEVLYVWISESSAPPYRICPQLPVFIHDLFLSTLLTKPNKTWGGLRSSPSGPDIGRNIVREPFGISVP